MSLITLTTDFGLQDWFVGTLKGVILAKNPRATIVDITHGIAAGDMRGGALALAASCRFFPKHTIHVAVVDPGVGSARRAIAVKTERYLFLGPDNGVLSSALRSERIRKIHVVSNEKYFLDPVSRTFHGRDVFAPVAAQLSLGLPLDRVGPATQDFVNLPWPQPKPRRSSIEGEVMYIDRFGNGITNLDQAALKKFPKPAVYLKRKRLCGVSDFYQAVPLTQPVAIFGSSGLLEIAVNGGSAAERYGIKVGDRVKVLPSGSK